LAVQQVDGKLSNSAFLDNAPAEVIEKEPAKLAEAERASGKLAEHMCGSPVCKLETM
jgi:valyl-tRNA synthetase